MVLPVQHAAPMGLGAAPQLPAQFHGRPSNIRSRVSPSEGLDPSTLSKNWLPLPFFPSIANTHPSIVVEIYLFISFAGVLPCSQRSHIQ